jgi:hypothetical protein
MRYIPSPIPVGYKLVFTATSNKSGRMQYHQIRPGVSKHRISRTEFIRIWNKAQILAIRPVKTDDNESDFQIEFYV